MPRTRSATFCPPRAPWPSTLNLLQAVKEGCCSHTFFHLQSWQLLTGCTKTSAANPNVRVDAGVREGSSISMFYDPMICKLVELRTRV